MGVEFYIADTKNKRAFGLGRGYWISVLKAIQDRCSADQMCRAVWDDWANRYLVEEEVEEHMVRSLRMLGEVLWAFCKSADWCVELRNDCANYPDELDEDEKPLYKYVFSRYNDGYIDQDPCADEMEVFLDLAAVTRPKEFRALPPQELSP